MMVVSRRVIAAWFLFFTTWGGILADEGMWPFNELPRAYLKQRHDFEPTEAWARHLMLASVRFNSGGSASFVSSNGLVLTNHHVGSETLQKVSTAERDYLRDGFLARSPSEEIKAPDLELNQLISIEDVTQRVLKSIRPQMSAGESLSAQRAVMAQIERESLGATGLRSDVVELYGGARFHLYRYKKYTDVRLVFAPESAVAFLGGDADNFEFPRYCLDICLFRVYEGDRPARIPHFLAFSKAGAADGELVFVSGNPGRTQRSLTTAALKFERDTQLPLALDHRRRREILLQQFSMEGDEQERRARDEYLSIQNSRKALTGMLQGLQDPVVMARKQRQEDTLRSRVANDRRLAKYSGAWDAIARLTQRRGESIRQTASFANRLYDVAEQLVFLAAEDRKPNAERLPEYRDSNRESLLQQLLSTAPIFDDLEQVLLADSIALMVERRGGDHPLVRSVLAGKNPQARAAELVRDTGLRDVSMRKRFIEGGQAAIDASTDSMIRLAKLIEPEARRLREMRGEVAESERQAYAQIADAKFALFGTAIYPDATFTLRLSFGRVRGYEENGRAVPPWTTIAGAFQHEVRHGGKEPWVLPQRWHDRKQRLQDDTPFNFVCTADTVGGNSGSPVVNGAGEFVGIIFDGNIQSLKADYDYSEEQARSIAVDSRIISEALRMVYDAESLANELGH